MIIIGTGVAGPLVDRCKSSIDKALVGLIGVEPWDCHFSVVDNARTGRAHFDFLTERISIQKPEEIVVSVDLDDTITPDALVTVKRAHDRGAWVTYGSFRYEDGRKGFAAQCKPETCRRDPWVATHLKTFRAGLFNRIKREDLMFEGSWLKHGRDQALMLPCLEMARERSVFVPDGIYVYSYGTSTEFKGPESVRAEERRCVAHVRGLKPYERVDAL